MVTITCAENWDLGLGGHSKHCFFCTEDISCVNNIGFELFHVGRKEKKQNKTWALHWILRFSKLKKKNNKKKEGTFFLCFHHFAHTNHRVYDGFYWTCRLNRQFDEHNLLKRHYKNGLTKVSTTQAVTIQLPPPSHSTIGKRK